jgi:hypothetical protein
VTCCVSGAKRRPLRVLRGLSADVPMRNTLILTALLFTVAACSSKSPATSTQAPAPVSSGATSTPAPARRDPRLITQAELDSTNVSTAWEAIMRLRPAFLRDADRSSVGSTDTRPEVRLDNADFGSTDALKSLSLSGIAEIRYLDASQATARFGTRSGRPMIWLTTRRAGR